MPYAKSSLYNIIYGNSNGNMKGGRSTKNTNYGSVFRLMSEKKQFILLTFANLIIQLGITYYFMEQYTITFTKYQLYGLVILTGIISFLLASIPMPSWLKFIIFTILSTIFGVILSSLKKTINPEILNLAIIGTIAIYGTMFTIGLFMLMTGIELSYKFGIILFFSLLTLILFEITSLIIGTSPLWHKILSIIGLLLFSIYIIYDTNQILQRNYYGDFITASLDYYYDILNVFLELLDVLGVSDN
jgi:FtsH-binding integral membrane protein